MDALDEYGDQLFGRRIRLRVLLWAHTQKQAFNQSEASKGVDYSSSGEVAKELERLVRLGMLRKFGRPSASAPRTTSVSSTPGGPSPWRRATAVRAGLKDEYGDEADGAHRADTPGRSGRDDGPDAPVRLRDVGRDDRG